MPLNAMQLAYKKKHLNKNFSKEPVTKVVAKLKKEVKHLMKVDKMEVTYDDDYNTSINNINPQLTASVIVYPNASLPSHAGLLTSADSKVNYVLYKSMRIHLRVTASTQDTLRVIVFQDRSNSQALPLIGALLETDDPTSPYNYDFFARFKILKDKIYHCDAKYQTLALGAQFQRTLPPIHISFKDLKVEYTGTTGTSVSNCQTNNIFIAFMGSVGASNIFVEGHVRTKYEGPKTI